MNWRSSLVNPRSPEPAWRPPSSPARQWIGSVGQDADRRARLATLQKDFNDARDARDQRSTLMKDPTADDAVVDELQTRVARAELRSDDMMGQILSTPTVRSPRPGSARSAGQGSRRDK